MLKENSNIKSRNYDKYCSMGNLSFQNHTDNIVRVLVIIAPAGMEKLFEEVGTEVFDVNIAKTTSPSNEEKKRSLEISKRYGIEIIA